MSWQGWRDFLAADGVEDWVVLHGGALIADGPPAEVIRRPQVAEIYMGIEADV